MQSVALLRRDLEEFGKPQGSQSSRTMSRQNHTAIRTAYERRGPGGGHQDQEVTKAGTEIRDQTATVSPGKRMKGTGGKD